MGVVPFNFRPAKKGCAEEEKQRRRRTFHFLIVGRVRVKKDMKWDKMVQVVGQSFWDKKYCE